MGKPNRTVKARGAILRSERNRKQLTIAQLSEQAGVSESRIRMMEQGNPVFRDTLTRVANTLLLDYQTVVDDDEFKLKRQKASIHISIEFDPTSPPEIVQKLVALISAQDPVSIVSVRKGSVFLNLEMSVRDVERLTHAHLDGRLTVLNVDGRSHPSSVAQ